MAAATALLSMWISNIAEAAVVISAILPLTADTPVDDREGNGFRRALLLGVAAGANFGGIATPVGTGPNAIAIAAVSRQHPVTFLHWTAFALPLSIGLVAAALLLIALRFRVRGRENSFHHRAPIHAI